MKAYIRSASCLSAQKTFKTDGFLDEIISYDGTRLKAYQPDYKEFIDPKLIRRMSHVIKMGVAAGRDCLNKAGIQNPGAIITGSAYGCIEDTVTFLTRIIEMNEQMLPPTAFIQSTHNTVAAQIALSLQCHSYNNTFVHKGVSFEHALLDSLMLLNEQETDNVLVGGLDELTDTSFKILTRLGVFKRKPINNLDLFKDDSPGTIGGEGAAFFLLSNKLPKENLGVLQGIRIIYKPVDKIEIEEKITGLLAETGLTIKDIDFVLTGRNGNLKDDAVYNNFSNFLFQTAEELNYKHLCGEYPASPAFALWVTANILKTGNVPAVLAQHPLKRTSAQKILIYNHYQREYHSLMLVTA